MLPSEKDAYGIQQNTRYLKANNRMRIDSWKVSTRFCIQQDGCIYLCIKSYIVQPLHANWLSVYVVTIDLGGRHY